MQTLEVRRAELETTRLGDEDDPVANEGQAVLAIERFGLTTNNVTYGLAGDLMGYWRFFAASGNEGWGRVPAWGIATVRSSRSHALRPGDRLFGFVPMGTHLLIEPRLARRGGVVDVSAHRAQLPLVYNLYSPAPSTRENQAVILRPLFLTAVVLDTAMAGYGAEQIVVSSASARTASALAFLASQRDVNVVGLTSPHNRDWVKTLDVYDEVLTYDQIDALDRRSSVFVDVAGNPSVRDSVHQRLADDLRHSASLGMSHGHAEAFAAPSDLPGPQPEFFFAPDHVPDRDPASIWEDYCAWTDGWLTFSEHAGVEAARGPWRQVVNGEVSPSTATVISTGEGA